MERGEKTSREVPIAWIRLTKRFMTLYLPSRLIRLAFFTLSAGCAGLISAEATAFTLCAIMMVAACCRGSIRVELVLTSVVAFAVRYSGPDLGRFKAVVFAVLPLVLALAGIYIIVRSAFGPPRRPPDSWLKGSQPPPVGDARNEHSL